MSKHTPDEIRDFAQKHAPALAEKISALCGDVITKGMVGILEEVCRLQAQRDALLDALQGLLREHDAVFAKREDGAQDSYYNAHPGRAIAYRKARAAIATATQEASHAPR